MKKFLIFWVVCIATASVAQPSASDVLPLDPKTRSGVLPNGMKYYIRYNAKPEKRAELRLVVNAGSTLENDDQQGLAHFVEHMAFNGTKNFRKNELVDYLESLGTKFGPDLNAYTSFDETVYMLQIPTDKDDVFKKGFLILEDWAHNLSFDSVEVEKERGVVYEEWRLGQGAFERMSRKYWPVLFKDSRYAVRFPIGKPEILKNCRQSLLSDFYRQWYRPDLQAVVVVGDIDVEATEKLVKEQFSKIPPSNEPKPVPAWNVPDQPQLRVSVVSDEEAPYNIMQLMYFQKTEGVKTKADYRKLLLRNLFNGMVSARLNEVTKKPDAPLMYAGAGYHSIVRTKDAYASFALFPNGKALEALEAVVTENERVRRFGFSESEFERMKKQILTDFEQKFNEREKTESKRIIGEYVRLFLEEEAVPGIEAEFTYVKEMLPGIKLSEVNSLASSWIVPEGKNGIVIMMMSEKKRNDKPTEAQVRAAFARAEKNPKIEKYVDRVANLPLLTKAPAAGKVIGSKDKGFGVTEWALSNGARVVVKPTDFKEDEVLLTAHSWGGSQLYPVAEYRSADYSNAVQEEMGFGNYDQVGLEKYLQDKKAHLSTYVTRHEEGLQGGSSRKDLAHLLELVNAAFTEPRYDSSAFIAFKQRQKAFFQNLSADPNYTFRDSVQYIMSGYDPRSAPETEKTMDEVQLYRAYQIYRERYADPADFVFTIVGSFNTDTLRRLVEQYIAGIPSKGLKEQWKDAGIRPPQGQLSRSFMKGNEPRSTVQMYWTGKMEYNRKNRFQATAVSNLLNIKLRESLREDKGGVYGVRLYPGLSAVPEGRYSFVCSFSCDPEKVQELVAAARVEIGKVKAEGCNDVDLTKVKETLLKEREVQLKENRFWLSYISHADIYKEDLADLDQFTEWVNGLSSKTLQDFVAGYFNDAEFKQFVLNPEQREKKPIHD